jgi:hypothetical protein
LQRLHCRRPDGSRPMCLHVGWSGMSLCSCVIGLVLGQDPASRTVSRLDYNSPVPAWYYCPAAPLSLPEQPRLLRGSPTCLERCMSLACHLMPTMPPIFECALRKPRYECASYF